EEIVASYERHVSPISGAIRSLRRLAAGPGRLLHSYDAGPNLAHFGDPLNGAQAGFRAHAGGKGRTDVDARASAIGEALERYSGVFHGDEPRRRARAVDLGERAIAPNDCMLWSAAQYERRRAWNHPGRPPHEIVPEPFSALTA